MRRQITYTSLIWLLFVGACTMSVAPRPGAADLFDSQSYDRLLEASAAIEQAKASFAAGKLPADSKALINAAISSYNVAQAGWHTYHDAHGAMGRDMLAADIAKLTAAVAEIFRKNAPAPVLIP